MTAARSGGLSQGWKSSLVPPLSGSPRACCFVAHPSGSRWRMQQISGLRLQIKAFAASLKSRRSSFVVAAVDFEGSIRCDEAPQLLLSNVCGRQGCSTGLPLEGNLGVIASVHQLLLVSRLENQTINVS